MRDRVILTACPNSLTIGSTLSAALERERDDANRRADKLQATLDKMADELAKQGKELTAIRKMLRRREEQLARAEREVRKLRRRFGLDDPDPDPGSVATPPDGPGAGRPDKSSTSDEGSSKNTKGSTRAETSPAEPLLDGITGVTEPVETEGTNHTPEPKPPRKRREGGRRPPPVHVPADVEHRRVTCCGHCGQGVLQRDVLETSVYTAVRSYVRRRILYRDRVICRDPTCRRATTAPMPPMPCERALYDCSFIAWLVTMKFAHLLPLDRIQAMLASQGVNIAMGTLVSLIERASDLLGAIDGEHLKQLKAGKYICFDGTGLKVLVPEQDKAWDGYLEVYTRDQLTVFQFDITKHADELEKRLSGIEAILVTDAESRNRAGAPGATFAHCNAHVVRAYDAAERVQPELAQEGRAFLEELYAIEREAKTLGLAEVLLYEHRQRCRPVLERYRGWLTAVVEGDLPPTDPVVKTAKYYHRHWEGLTLFVDEPDVPLDNNESEREFQRHAKLRLASLFAGSIEGAYRWAVLLGVVRTAQKHGLDVQAYLTWVLERRGTHRDLFGMAAWELTPAAYVAAGYPGSLTEAVAAIAA